MNSKHCILDDLGVRPADLQQNSVPEFFTSTQQSSNHFDKVRVLHNILRLVQSVFAFQHSVLQINPKLLGFVVVAEKSTYPPFVYPDNLTLFVTFPAVYLVTANIRLAEGVELINHD